MLRAWASGKKAQLNSSSQSLTADKEAEQLQEAMGAVMHIMNDDLEAAKAGLEGGESSFHKLGIGLVNFLRAALGFEKDVMKEAQESLWAAEAQTTSEQKRVLKEAGSFKSQIYDQGAEFALTNAECLLMGAMIGLISESLSEALKGVYNMRKAYMALNSIIESETRFLEGQKSSAVSTPLTAQSAATTRPSSKAPSVNSDAKVDAKDTSRPASIQVDDEGDAFTDAPEVSENMPTPMDYQGRTEIDGVTKNLTAVTLDDEANENPTDNLKKEVVSVDHSLFVHPIDIYIYSGSNLCFGLLLLLLSMIPPAFGRILSIIGFRGDRERGLKMLWQASKFDNINGAMAGLGLFAWYNGAISFCDIIPEGRVAGTGHVQENISGYPASQLRELLTHMRQSFPQSGLWKLEEARMLATSRQVDESLTLLRKEIKSPLKQVNALAMFERSLQAIAAHDYELCATSFIECTKLNNWSHALYFYIAGTAYVELYRKAKLAGDDTLAEAQHKKAEQCFGEVPSLAGKRRFMARTIPFEAFCLRKLARWDEHAKEWGVSRVDAIGVSPFEEMVWFWNIYKRMQKTQLQKSLENLNWSSDASKNANWEKFGTDEKGLLAVLRASTLRSLGDFEEAKKILQDDVIAHDRNIFKGGNRDDFVAPVAHYEMAANLWQERSDIGKPEEGNAENVRRVKEAQGYLDTVKNWETFTLDARVGMKVASGIDTLKKWMEAHGEK